YTPFITGRFTNSMQGFIMLFSVTFFPSTENISIKKSFSFSFSTQIFRRSKLGLGKIFTDVLFMLLCPMKVIWHTLKFISSGCRHCPQVSNSKSELTTPSQPLQLSLNKVSEGSRHQPHESIIAVPPQMPLQSNCEAPKHTPLQSLSESATCSEFPSLQTPQLSTYAVPKQSP